MSSDINFMVIKYIETTIHVYTKIIEEIYLYRKTYITTILVIDSWEDLNVQHIHVY